MPGPAPVIGHKVWEAHTGEEFSTLKGVDGGVTSLSYGTDGKRLVTWQVLQVAQVSVVG